MKVKLSASTFWIRKINWTSVLICGAIYTVIATIIHQIEAFISMGYYQNPEYFGTWSKLMMPESGPPPLNFFLASLIFTFISGISLALVYYYIQDLLPKKFWHRVTFFADLLIGLSFVFFTLPSYLMFNIPGGLLISWFISSFITLLIASWTFVKWLK